MLNLSVVFGFLSPKGAQVSVQCGAAATVFVVLHLNEVLHVSSVNNGMQKSQVNTKSIIKSWVFQIYPLISFRL